MSRRLLSLLALVAATATVGCSHRPDAHEARTEVRGASRDRAALLAAEMRNDNVKWDGTLLGLDPQIVRPASVELESLGDAAVPHLLRALHDPQRYAAAHVLLTRIAGEPYSADAEGWNGLRVSLHADGRVDVFAEDIPALAQKWDAWARDRAVAGASHNPSEK
jgi:hypothetical protein